MAESHPQPPARPRMEHAALSVRNLERSIEFYTGVFSLTLFRTVEAPPESGLGAIVGLPDCRARIAHLCDSDDFERCRLSGDAPRLLVELFEYQNPVGKPTPAQRTQADIGFNHIGFQSFDIQRDYRRLAADGVECLNRPIEFRPNVWVLYFRGPDGEVCEFRQS